MDDNAKSNSWDDLLQDLGAKPDESAYERHQAPAQEIPPTVEWAEAEQPAAESKTSPSDWNALAESMGLEVEESSVAAEPVAEETEESETNAFAATNAATDAATDSNEPLIGFAESEEASYEQEPDDSPAYETSEEELPPLPTQMDQALSETAWDESSEQDSDENETSATEESDKDGEGISGEAARSAFDALFSDGASSWGSAFLTPSQRENQSSSPSSTFEGESTESLDAKTGAGGEEEDSERPKRKRSRRRRRGGKGRKPVGERTAEGETNDEQNVEDRDELSERAATDEVKKPRRRRSGQRSRRVEATDESDFDENLQEDEEASDTERPKGEHRGRQRHRNLPTWSDAIGMIVDANLEQRAKSPSKPQSSRGGRGGRGGRGRRRKSPESK